MKRDKHLVTLSWEHHNGLVTAFRIKQGLKKKANTADIAQFIKYIWENELHHHFKTEEAYLVPAISGITGNAALFDRFRTDHIEIEKIVEGLCDDPKSMAKQIGLFAELLEKHIRFEEREFFPFIEEHINPKILETIGKKLHAAHQPACSTWQPEFWK